MSRLIARLDIKNNDVIKGINLEGLRKVGNPLELAVAYYEQGIDEIVFMDAVASLYDRNNLFRVIAESVQNVFVPVSLGGGIRSLSDIEQALTAGADKVIINTAAIKSPALISSAAKHFGSQCIVGSIEAKRVNGDILAYFDNGREPTTLKVSDWAVRLQDLGIGELLVTSVDREGTGRGFDLELYELMEKNTNCPIVVSGGHSEDSHIRDLLEIAPPSGIAIASTLHYRKQTVQQLRSVVESAACK